MTRMKSKTTLFGIMSAWLFITMQIAMANEVKGEEFKPFAEKHIILQLSDQANEAVVIDTANNLIKNYGGPDMIDIEIVTFGKGVRLMYADNQQQVRHQVMQVEQVVELLQQELVVHQDIKVEQVLQLQFQPHQQLMLEVLT